MLIDMVLGILGVPGLPGDEQAVAELIRRRGQMLLILDEAEMQLDVVGGFVDMLVEQCEAVSVLISSRIRLKHEGVAPCALGPLALMDAVRLSFALSSEFQADRTISVADQKKFTKEVGALGCLPLAIELANSRGRAVTDQTMQVVPRDVDETRLDVDDAMERTLRWSWDRLKSVEQRLLSTLCCFKHSFDSEAAQAVVQLDYEIGSIGLAQALESLNEQGLLRRISSASAEPRFEVLSIMRTFVLGLDEARRPELPEPLASTEFRHALFYARLGQRPYINALRLSGALARSPLWFEKQNLIQAFEFAWKAGELHIVARLAIAMGYLGLMERGSFEDARIERLMVSEEIPIDLRLDLFLLLAERACMAGQFSDCLRMLEDVKQESRRHADHWSFAHAAYLETRALRLMGRSNDGLNAGAIAIESGQRSGNRYVVIQAKIESSMCARSLGGVDDALFLGLSALSLSESIGSDSGIASSAVCLGLIYRMRGGLHDAHEQYERALRAYVRLGDLKGQTRALSLLGIAQTYLGLYELAIRTFTRAIDMAEWLGNTTLAASLRIDYATARLYQEPQAVELDAYEAPLAFFRDLNMDRFVAIALGHIGRYHLQQKAYQPAKSYLETAIESCERCEVPVAAAAYRVSLVQVLTRLGHFDEALREAVQASAVLASSDPYEFGALRCAMGELYWMRGEHQKYRDVMADAKLRIGRFELPDTAPLMLALNRTEQVVKAGVK
ncbi:MAG: tetratricopeptide repeat protein, partial [Bradymonadia bacterium]